MTRVFPFPPRDALLVLVIMARRGGTHLQSQHWEAEDSECKSRPSLGNLATL